MRGICKASVVLVSLVLATAACGDDSSESSDTTAASDQSESSDTTAAADQEGSTYVTRVFSEPFEVTAPALLPTEPSIDESNFVTWESTASDGPAVRFLVPVNVFPPGSTDTTPPPDDYLAYLLAQAEHGAHFVDQTETTVGARPATLLTATVDESLDGSLGCPEQDMAAGDCFGLQPENTLRMAVIDVGDRTLLAWLRHDNRTDTDAAASSQPSRRCSQASASETKARRRPSLPLQPAPSMVCGRTRSPRRHCRAHPSFTKPTR